MRLPAHLLATLTLVASCEPAHHEPACKSEPIVVRPHAGPKLVQPTPPPQPTQPQQPQPVVKKQEKRLVCASVCGHAQLVPEKAALARCGRG
jgi:hypothetical protein